MAAPAHTLTLDDVLRARRSRADVVRHTPVLPSLTVTQRAGGEVVLKAESLQRTGSFKIRGALNKLAALGERCARGVTAGSAGNHAWALSQAASVRGVPCEVFMPAGASLSKAEGCVALGADRRTRQARRSTTPSTRRAARAEEAGMAFVHPFDDLDVIAGQGTLGLELLEDVPDLAKVVVPRRRRRAGRRRRAARSSQRAARRRDRRRPGRQRRGLPGVAAPRRAGRASTAR